MSQQKQVALSAIPQKRGVEGTSCALLTEIAHKASKRAVCIWNLRKSALFCNPTDRSICLTVKLNSEVAAGTFPYPWPRWMVVLHTFFTYSTVYLSFYHVTQRKFHPGHFSALLICWVCVLVLNCFISLLSLCFFTEKMTPEAITIKTSATVTAIITYKFYKKWVTWFSKHTIPVKKV